MKLLPIHEIGLLNAWWFSLLYFIISFIMLGIMPKDRRQRILKFPKFESKMEKLISGVALIIFSRGLIVYTIFIPIKISSITTIIGVMIYFTGMLSSVYSMWLFSKEDLDKPVTGGVFKISRHPMQVMSIVMWIGVGIASMNWIVIAAAIFLAFFSYPSFIAQEKFCIDKYGQSYIEYMKKTRRYIFF